MPDELRPEDRTSDARDDRVAGLLAVEPLDEVTRHRLVTTAMRSTGSARRARQLVAAAAIVFVAVAGAGVVVAMQGGRDDNPEAVTAEAAPRDAAGAASDTLLGASVPDVGDFGELTSAANVARLRTALATVSARHTSPQSPAAGGKASESTSSDLFSARAKELSCSPSLPEGVTVAVATGTYGERNVIVVQREVADGARSLYAVEVGTCEVHRLS